MKDSYKISLKSPWGPIGGIFFCVIMLFTFLFGQNVAAENSPKEPKELYALSATVLDGDTNRILYGKENEVKRANASTTKILTCILALEKGNLEDYVAVSSYAASMPNVQLGIKEGEYYRLEDMLYSLMLESHNDVAVSIAEHVSGSVEAFANQMNQKAKEIGCSNTSFFTPNGLDYKEGEAFHGTTSDDLAKIMSYCVWKSEKKDAFLKITQTMEHAFTNYSRSESGEFSVGSRRFGCRNHNSYLSMNQECISGKTGFTGEAGYCYIGAVESEGRHFVVALLGCGWPNNKSYKWKDCDKLFGYAKENYHFRSLPDCAKELEGVTLLQGANKDYDLSGVLHLRPRVNKGVEKVLMADWEELKVCAEYPKEIYADKIGENQVGTVTISVGNHQISQENIRVNCKVEKRNLPWYFQGILRIWCLVNFGN